MPAANAWRRSAEPKLVGAVALVAAYLPSSSDQISFSLFFIVTLWAAWRLRESPVLGFALLVAASVVIRGSVTQLSTWPVFNDHICRFEEQWFEIPFGASLLCSPILLALLLGGAVERHLELVAIAISSVLFSLAVVWGVNWAASRTAVNLTALLLAGLPLVLLRECWLIWILLRSSSVVEKNRWAYLAALLALGPFVVVYAGRPFMQSGVFKRAGASLVAVLSNPDDRTDNLKPISECGAHNLGLWGELPQFLRLAGYHAKLVDDLSQLAALPPKVLVLLPTGRLLTEADRAALHRLVAQGTSLLVVGEHTNLDHVMESFNPLLAEYGLKLRYDTTNSLLGDGMKALRYGSHPVGDLLKRVPLTTYNRGASLEVTGPDVVPILSGILWHADAGDPLVPDRAYLGDQELSSGDRVGDLLLVAANESAGHKVIVFGDSSPFLNQNLAHNSPLLLGLFAYLTASDSPASRGAGIAWCVALGLALAGGSFFMPRSWLTAVAACGMGVLSAVVHVREFSSEREFRALFTVPAKLAAISIAEANQFSLDPFSGSSMTGLAMQLLRSGYVPFLGDWYPVADQLAAVVLINPTRMPAARRVEALHRMSRRGVSIVLAGSGESAAFRSLGATMGAAVEPIPLGSRPGKEFTTASAWPVELEGKVERRFVVENLQVGGVMSNPRTTVIADEAFFYSKNVEWHGKCDERNLEFIASLLPPLPDPDRREAAEE